MSVDYGVKDIKTLEGIEAIRLRPGIIDYCIEHQYEYIIWRF
jgi:DNA gyrase/topoisomerase IV subunit B